MKKVLVLMLVLGIASLANATLNLKVTVEGSDYDGSDLAVGTLVTVAVIQDATNVAGSGGEMWVNFVGDAVEIVDTTPSPNYAMGDFYGWNWLLNAGVSFVGDTAWKGASASPGVGTPGIGANMNVIIPTPYTSTFEFTFAAVETFDLSMGGVWDSVQYDGSPMCAINVVPEPMTMALLGLGGLFLRRRK